MEVKKLPLSFYIEKLKNNDPFSQGMYGDGEWYCLMGQGTENAEHTIYSPQLRQDLADSLNYKADNFYFSIPALFWEHPQLIDLGKEIDKFMGDRKLNAVDKQIWNDETIRGNLAPLIQQLRQMDVYIVSNRSLRGLWFLKYKGFYEISYPNCYIDGSLKRAGDEILRERKDGVYIIAAGLPAALLAQKLHKEMPNSWFIDVGSIFDVFVGIGAQRSFRADMYAHPDKWDELNRKNIGL